MGRVMYTPAEFAEHDVARAHALIERHSFGLLVVPSASGAPEIAHIPFLLDPAPSPFGTLRAHVARASAIAAMLASDLPVVAVFTGPHAYVTPRWYEAPRANVPTWNYATVHAHGVARAIRERDEVVSVLRDLSTKYEAGAPAPWTMQDADASYVERLLGGIVAFTLRIERLEAKAKLSQNRSPADRAQVALGLRARSTHDDVAVAELMEEKERSRARLVPLTETDFATVAKLGETIWHEHYGPMIGRAQVEYMIAGRYVPEKLRLYLDAKDRWFELLVVDGQPVGYCSYAFTAPDEMKLEQLYCLSSVRGRGFGSRMLRHVEEQARRHGRASVWLQVNRRNESSIAIYRKAGFTVREEAKFDIGGGYVMDDYVMVKRV